MSDERSEGLQGGEGDPGRETLLDSLDQMIGSLPPGDPLRRELLHLRPQMLDQQETMIEARRMIEKLEEVVKKVTSPANRIGTFLGATSKETAHIVVGGADYYCNVDPRIPLAKLKKGTRVLVNEAFVIVGDLGFETAGPVTKITEVIGKDRLRVGSEHGLAFDGAAALLRSCPLQLEIGRRSPRRFQLPHGVGDALQHQVGRILPRHRARSCRGKKSAARKRRCKAIKDAIELPLLHPIFSQNFSMLRRKVFCFTARRAAARRSSARRPLTI